MTQDERNEARGIVTYHENKREDSTSLMLFANALRDCLDLEPLPTHDGRKKR